jgi:hypothetical protein
MVGRKAESLNRDKFEQRINSDIERNSELKNANPNPKSRKREIEQSIRKAERIQQDGLSAISRTLEERNRNTERLQEEFTRDHQDVSELLRRTQETCRNNQLSLNGGSEKSLSKFGGGAEQSLRGTRISNQLSLGDFAVHQGEIKHCHDRERRENPRMAEGTKYLGDRIGASVRELKAGIWRGIESVKRIVDVTKECFLKHDTITKNLANLLNGLNWGIADIKECFRRHDTIAKSLTNLINGLNCGISNEVPPSGLKTQNQISLSEIMGTSEKKIKPVVPPEYKSEETKKEEAFAESMKQWKLSEQQAKERQAKQRSYGRSL